ILENIRLAKERYHSDLVIFPELALTGYPPEDLLYRASLFKQVSESIQSICNYVNDICVISGYPLISNGKRFNACSFIKNGEIKHTYFKQNLPNYSVFDEKRYFEAGHEPCVFEIKGIPTALSICEDIWDKSVCEQAVQAGAKLMININASPYHIDKISLRKQILKQRVAETGMNIVYVNMTGGQDELVFDGGSMTIDNQGNINFQAPQFKEGLYIVDFALDDNGHFSTPIEYPPQNITREESIYLA